MGNGIITTERENRTIAGVMEYQLVAVPDEAVCQLICLERAALYSLQNSRPQAIPHLLLAKFQAKEAMEDTLLRWMHRVISNHRRFVVALNNYGGSLSQRSVYLRIQDTQYFKKLADGLKVIDHYIKSSHLPQAEVFSSPHLLLGKNLDAADYDSIMKCYSNKDFHAEFLLEKLILLKRTTVFEDLKQVSVFRLTN